MEVPEKVINITPRYLSKEIKTQVDTSGNDICIPTFYVSVTYDSQDTETI